VIRFGRNQGHFISLSKSVLKLYNTTKDMFLYLVWQPFEKISFFSFCS
jgi:hypothetical protein